MGSEQFYNPGAVSYPSSTHAGGVALFTQLTAQGKTEQEALSTIVASRDDASTTRDAGATHYADTAHYAGVPMLHPATGALPYGLGFLAYLPIPIFSLLIAGIVMVAVYPSQRRHGGVAALNARRAANWGLTVIAGFLAVPLFLLLIALVGPIVDPLSSSPNPFPRFSVFHIPVLFYFVLGIAHVVILIMGLVKCKRGEFFNNRLAIPFIR
ncbi:MAG: DUF4870 domain-containing protein [Rhodoglobus sp.]